MIDDALLSTAIHESGHAVVGELLGERPRQVVIFSAGEGHCRSLALVDHDPQDRIVVLLAGRAAELAFGFTVSPSDSNKDQQQARGLALRIAGYPGSGSIDTADWIFRHAQRRADELAHDHADAIRIVAERLLANGGRLAGSEVSAALEAAFGGYMHRVHAPDRTGSGTSVATTEADIWAVQARLRRSRAAQWRDIGRAFGARRGGATTSATDGGRISRRPSLLLVGRQR